MPMPLDDGTLIYSITEIQAAQGALYAGTPLVNPPLLQSWPGIQMALDRLADYEAGRIGHTEVLEFPTPTVPARPVERPEPGEVVDMPAPPAPAVVPLPVVVGGVVLLGGVVLVSGAALAAAAYIATQR